MAQRPQTTQGTLVFLRILHVTLLVSIALYLDVIRTMPAKPAALLDNDFFFSLGTVAMAILGYAQAIRLRRLRPTLETLRMKPDDAQSLAQWRYIVILCDCLAESVALFGIAIHFLGGTYWQVVPFFIVGGGAMLAWWPTGP